MLEHNPIYDCPKCDKAFDTKHGLAIHKGLVHKPNWFQKLLKKIFK